jgi:hypothetical protein
VHNGRGAQLINQVQNAISVADIEFMVLKVREFRLEPTLVPSGVPLRPKKVRSRVVIDPVDLPTASSEVCANFRPDQTRRSCKIL